MNKLFCVLVGIGTVVSTYAQKFTTEKSSIVFFSDAALEDITATNSKAISIFDATKGEVAFSVPIKEFEFEKALMKEHFNEKYLESEKFPKATFQGVFEGFTLSQSGEQPVTAKGKLTIHGVTREVVIPGTLEFSAGKVVAKAKFIIKLEDYKVKIPQIVWQNIAEEVEVTIEFNYQS